MDYDAKIAKTPDELEVFLLALVESGVDIFHVSQRRFWEPAFEDSDLSLAGWTKKITGKAVIAVGSIGMDKAIEVDMFEGKPVLTTPASLTLVEEKLQNKEFDLVAVGRALLADPNWTKKMKNNQMDKVIPFNSDSLAILT